MPKKKRAPSASLSSILSLSLAVFTVTTISGVAIGQTIVRNVNVRAQLSNINSNPEEAHPEIRTAGTSSVLHPATAKTGIATSPSSSDESSSSSSSSMTHAPFPPSAGNNASSSSFTIPPVPPVFSSSSSSSFDREDYEKKLLEEAEKIRKEQEENAHRAREQMEEAMKRAQQEGPNRAAIETATETAPGTPAATGCYDKSGTWTTDVTKCDWDNQRAHYEKAQAPVAVSSSRQTVQQNIAPTKTSDEREVEILVENRFIEQKKAELLSTITEGRQRLAALLAANILPVANVPDVRAVHDWLAKMYDYYLVQSVTSQELQEAGANVRASLQQIQTMTERLRVEREGTTDPRLEYIVTRLRSIVDTIPAIIAIFQREKLPVNFETLNAYVQAQDLLGRAMEAGCPVKEEACVRLNDVIEKLQITNDNIKRTLDERGTDALRREIEGLN